MEKITDSSLYTDYLKKIIPFKQLSQEALESLSEIAVFHKYTKGEKIVQEGDESPLFYGIAEGIVNVTVDKADKPGTFICALGDGDIFGEAGIFTKVKRTANVSSAEDCIICSMERKDILGFIKKHPTPGVKMLMLIIFCLLKKLRDANQELAYERKMSITQADIDEIIDEYTASP